jgi:hypothetical protein
MDTSGSDQAWKVRLADSDSDSDSGVGVGVGGKA